MSEVADTSNIDSSLGNSIGKTLGSILGTVDKVVFAGTGGLEMKD